MCGSTRGWQKSCRITFPLFRCNEILRKIWRCVDPFSGWKWIRSYRTELHGPLASSTTFRPETLPFFSLSLSPLPFSSSFLKPSPRERRIFATVVWTWLISSRTSYFQYLLGLVWVFFLFFFPSVSFVYRHNKKMKKMSRRRLEDFFVFFLIINIRLLD